MQIIIACCFKRPRKTCCRLNPPCDGNLGRDRRVSYYVDGALMVRMRSFTVAIAPEDPNYSSKLFPGMCESYIWTFDFSRVTGILVAFYNFANI